MSTIIVSNINKTEPEFEFVERKGIGHPDTLSDSLAEKLSREYSEYTLNKYGAVLHHNFDKVGLLGGSSYVSFGKGHLVRPIRVLINGRVSISFAGERIPVRKMLVNWTKEFFKVAMPMIDVDEDLEFHMNLSNQSSPGKTYEEESKKGARRRWFEPESLDDIPERKKLVSNDTSLGVGYAPFSKLEKLVIELEKKLTGEFKSQNNWMGTDVKIMGVRIGEKFHITMCIPQISSHVASLEEYIANLDKARSYVKKAIASHEISDFELDINTRDNTELRELYLTATGSSLESGDEGLVGRGNRVNGVISPMRPMSMEGASGKNPIYHIGKIYYVAAFEFANSIYEKYGIYNEVYLVSQSGRDLQDPWVTVVAVPNDFERQEELKKFIAEQLPDIPNLSTKILSGSLSLS